jgi:hypothetical protein
MSYYYSLLEELPSGINYVDLASGSFTGSSILNGDLSVTSGVTVDLASGSFTGSSVLNGDLSVISPTYVDLASGSFTGSSTLHGDLASIPPAGLIIDLAGPLIGSSSLHGDITVPIVGSKYGMGSYGIGPYSVLGPANIVTLLGDLSAQSTLGGEIEVVGPPPIKGWFPVAPCPPSLWTPVDPCDETESSSLELVE